MAVVCCAAPQHPLCISLPQHGRCRSQSFAVSPASLVSISPAVSARRQSSPCTSIPGNFVASQLQQVPTTTFLVSPRSSTGADLNQVMQPGDVLCVEGNGRLAQLGSAGGFMGHVLVVTGQPKRIELGSEDQCEIRSIWPRGRHEPLVWKVPVLESTRLRSGLGCSEVILHIEPSSGRLTMIGELVPLGKNKVHLGIVDAEPVELWQSPAAFRGNIQIDLVRSVVEDMLATGGSWSYATAAQALFYRSASLDTEGGEPTELLQLIAECWEVPPICTSIVVGFWQRYACKLACKTGSSALDLILQCMPLRADRSLPGELLSTMESCGWMSVACLPGNFQSRVV